MVTIGSGFGTRIEVLRATYEAHSFAPHSHDAYTFGYVLGGAGTFWCQGAQRFVCAGDIVVIPPGEVHTGSVREGAESLSYTALYVPIDIATMHAAAVGVTQPRPPGFKGVVLRDDAVRRAFLRLERELGSIPSRRSPGRHVDAEPPAFDELAVESAACDAIKELMRGHSTVASEEQRITAPPARESHLVRVVREVLEESFDRSDLTSLEALASRTGVTPYRVIRAFRQATGLAPHQYLVQVRVERARQFLTEGEEASLAAARAGFVDQSHLIYHFKKHVGVTPGTYSRHVHTN